MDTMRIKISLTILGMILGIAATGLVAALSMSETAFGRATVGGGGCGTGGCGGPRVDCCEESGFGTDEGGGLRGGGGGGSC
jgi:hypothetical protein